MSVDRDTLGRSTWTLLHAMADTVADDGLSDFVQGAGIILRRYPCSDCKQNEFLHCSANIRQLPNLSSRARQRRLPMRVVCVAWAARMHACVTRHARNSSEDTRRIGAEVDRRGDDDEAVARLIENLR